jgi:subtilisin-like proprotein convertase family protein
MPALPLRRRLLCSASTGVALLAVLAMAPSASAEPAIEGQGATVSETSGNGNGVTEPGESFALTEPLGSAEFDTLTGVSGTLTTSSPGVALTQATSAYPNFDFGSVADNLTPFAGTLADSAECGARLSFSLGVTTDQGTVDVPFSVPTGGAGPAASVDSSAIVAIPDGGTATSSVTVSDPGRVKNVRVRIDRIAHTYDGDLKIDLVAPDGTAVTLVNRRGGSGDDFVGTVFDQSAPQSIVSGVAPFTGTFRPEGDLGALDGLQQQGDWTLRVRDASFGDAGSIQGWGLDVAPAVCAGRPPPPPPVDPREPPGFANRSDKARGQWPDPPGFDHNNPRAHAAKPTR